MASILIVEDNASEASTLIQCLQKSGFEVLNVATAEAAKVMLHQKKFDAILMDVILPGQSGFGLCRELKVKAETAKIPIIICSGKTEKIDQTWGIKQGASAYFTKPINIEEVITTLNKLIRD